MTVVRSPAIRCPWLRLCSEHGLFSDQVRPHLILLLLLLHTVFAPSLPSQCVCLYHACPHTMCACSELAPHYV